MNAHNDSDAVNARERLGRRLREARLYLGLSLDEVARYLKINLVDLQHIETGKRTVEAAELAKFARFYRQSIASLTNEEEPGNALPPDVAHLARQISTLTAKDGDELARFVEYLTARRDSMGSGHGN